MEEEGRRELGEEVEEKGDGWCEEEEKVEEEKGEREEDEREE